MDDKEFEKKVAALEAANRDLTTENELLRIPLEAEEEKIKLDADLEVERQKRLAELEEENHRLVEDNRALRSGHIPSDGFGPPPDDDDDEPSDDA
jgi:hypothetical protein